MSPLSELDHTGVWPHTFICTGQKKKRKKVQDATKIIKHGQISLVGMSPVQMSI